MAERQSNRFKSRRKLPVDKGWAWVVLTASFMIMFIMQGTLRTFGIIFVELQRNFKVSSSMLSTVLTTQYISNSLSSLVVLNCLSKYLSSRTMIIIGSILCALTYLLDSLANTAAILPLFHVLTGFGIAFIHGPNYVNIVNYFNKYRGTATAFISCGSSIGQLLFSPLAVLLISEYGVNGTLLLDGAIFLQCAIFAMLLRPPSFYEKTQPEDLNPTRMSSTVLSCCNFERIKRGNSHIEHDGSERALGSTLLGSTSGSKCFESTNAQQRIEVLSCFNREGIDRENSHIKHGGSERTHKERGSNLLGSTSGSKCFKSTNAQQEIEVLISEKEFETETEMKKLENSVELSAMNNSHENKQSVRNVKLIDSEHDRQDFVTFDSTEPGGSATDAFLRGTNKNFESRSNHSKWQKIIGSVGSRLFKEKIYSMYFLASSISMSASRAPQTYFPSHANDIGLGRKEGAFFVAIAGFADLGGRILTTLIADRTFLNRSRFLGFVLFSHGIIGCFIPFYKSFWTFSAYCICYGASGGIVFAISPAILIDFIGENRFSQGLGFVYTFTAILVSIYYTLLGYLRDITGAYFVGFGINSFFLIFSGILFMSEACIKY